MAARGKQHMSATFIPGTMDDDYYMPPNAPELVAPEPKRINPEMSNQIADGLDRMDGRPSSSHLSPFPRLTRKLSNVPASDDELEATLESARTPVLNSNDPEMQLAWAADALVYVGVCADHEERTATAKPHLARPSTPRVEHQLKMDAMNITTFLADQHHPKAEFLRGMWLEWGRFGQREDKKEAFRCYSRAADRGYARAEYRIGMLYESYNDPARALRHYHRGVEAGDAASCYRLGMMTLRGQHGQQQDFGKAIDLIHRSAEAADENAAQGAYVYGMLLARELPQIEVPDSLLPFHEEDAKRYIEKAAYLKFAKAQLKMGSAYELCALGCDFDPVLSMHYNQLASKQGENEADMALSKWFLVGSEPLFSKNEELAYTYAERAAARGLATAEFALGYFHEIGMYVAVNTDEATRWYKKASKHGNEDAKNRIASLNRNERSLSKTQDHNAAVHRIRSQHGSKRGNRPERFKHRQQPSEASIPESPGYPPNGAAAGAGAGFPQRGASVVPYPEDDRPPTVQPGPGRASTAPYPLEDAPASNTTPRPGPTGGFFHAQSHPPPQQPSYQQQRSSSAHQYLPTDPRPTSAATLPTHPTAAGGARPYHSPLAHRPSPAPRNVSAGPGPKPYSASPASGAPKIDIGFEAPQIERRTPRPSRTPQPGQPQTQAPGQHMHSPPQQQHAYAGPQGHGPAPGPESPGLMSPGMAGLPHSNSMPNFDGSRASTPASRPGSRPPPEMRRPEAGGVGQQAGAEEKEKKKPPPSKGPKTFDEMGVAPQQKEGDCVLM